MAKPSIFSREYEKRMRRRKRNFLIIFIIISIMIIISMVKILGNVTDYSNIKQKMQAWIDSDSNQKNEEILSEKEPDQAEKEPELPKLEEESFEITLKTGQKVKAIYVKENEDIKFTNIETNDDGLVYDISQSGKKLLILENDQTITLYNVDGTSQIVSKEEYKSSKGDVFTRESTIMSNPQYLWNYNPKFVNDDNIIFVSNRPYFGTAATKQYLWITNISNNSDIIKWDLAAAKIEILEREEKGIKITVDGNIYYIDVNCNIAKQ
ncbi:hypothetical protein FDE76_13945 [Clostridium botulinum]|uniref:Secreted protein n=1 Tax=Clostridium botulinum (strain Eklund 17B / Type B) TaxID=935198 RepID=B2TPC1_CLOBB|nr:MULTISPECIES: hypothetical protein [unclassified Clostridium]ACD23331.1 putative secreted protein [Clostridium botulinum B str. Eklund 17B (NRP)]MBN1053018.1 hypothetical protein [Clostridium botulinum]MBN1056225.1 hypothetical protein [Clostridium botulinum]MBY6975261.1 hypothetical protein [Clostridium botulinum]MBY7000810.1 hypothetical protein [Clostridium botulinum]